jgi:S1-C subfamily serine protease
VRIVTVAIAAMAAPLAAGLWACGADAVPHAAAPDPAELAVTVSNGECAPPATGSGYVVGPGLAVTAAHVVAGAEKVEVTTATGEALAGTVVAFDPELDVAVVRVDGVDGPTAVLAPFPAGTTGTVAGAGQDFEVSRRVVARMSDIHGAGTVRKQALELRTELGRGDSGSGVVDEQGRLGGIVFAVSRDEAGVAWALDEAELAPVLARPLDEAVDTGRCVEARR